MKIANPARGFRSPRLSLILNAFIGLLLCGSHCTTAWAAVSFTNQIVNGSTAGTTTYNTASVTLTSNNIALIAVSARLASGNGPGPISSITGGGFTWVNWGSVNFGNAMGSAKTLRTELWCGVGTASAGALTITFATSPTNVTWSVEQSSGAANTCATAQGTLATNFADTATASPLTVTISPFVNPGSGTYVTGNIDGSGVATNPGTGITELGSYSGNSPAIETGFAAGQVSPATITYGSGPFKWGIIGVEILPPPSTNSRRPITIM